MREMRDRKGILAALNALAVGLAFVPSLHSTDGEGSVEVSSAQAFPARNIDTGEAAGHFLLVRANVKSSEATRSRLDFRESAEMAVVLGARLEVDGRQFLPCGAGGILNRLQLDLSLLLKQTPEAGEPISPLFYLPEGALDGATVVDLITVIQAVDGRWPESPAASPVPPVARASVPWDPDLMVTAKAARVDLISVETEEARNYKRMGSTRWVQAVRLRFPDGFRRLLRGGNGKLHCGAECADDLAVGDPFVARFTSPVDASSCPWELRFPGLGIKLELKLAKP